VSAAPAAPAPLSVPELGPSLGRLIVPRRLAVPWVPVDDVREALATDVMTRAGAARRTAATGDAAGAARMVMPGVWQDAWEHAVRRAAEIAPFLDAPAVGSLWRAARAGRGSRRLAYTFIVLLLWLERHRLEA